MKKREIRAHAQVLRDSIPESEKKKLDSLITQHVITWETFLKSACIFCYVSYRSEVNTYPILAHALKVGKEVAIPRVDRETRTMRAYLISHLERELCPGSYGILEPIALCPEAEHSKIGLIIAPGLAFTRTGGRLGYGSGYYDRFLKKNSKIPVCALTYERMIYDYLPVKEHDVPVDYLITESGLICTQRKQHERRI